MRCNKLIATLFLIITIVACVFPVFAEGTSEVTCAYMMEGSLYYCNSNTGDVVLKDIKPMMTNAEAKELAKALEYTETRLFDKNLYLGDGTQVEYDWLNNYADDKVRFIAVKQADGSISILYLKFV